MISRVCFALALGVALLAAPDARSADSVMVGAVGSASTNLWPVHIGMQKGFFAAEGVTVDLVYAQSNAAVVQQLAAGSINLSVSTGLVDPIRAIGKGAPAAIVRIEVQAPPYALLAKPSIRTIAELKGKTISLGGAKDITRIFVERMLAPNGVRPGEFDMVFAGATSARFSALQSGAVDAAILTAPFNFHAEAAGFTNLGLTTAYVKDLPFSGSVVNTRWDAANAALVQRFLSAYTKAIAWFQDAANREDAVRIMVGVSKLNTEEVEKSYDFLHSGGFFELSGRVSRQKLSKLVDTLRELGDIDATFAVDRLVLPGVTQMSD